MQNSELDSKFLTSEANYAQVNKKLGIAQAGFQTDVDSFESARTSENLFKRVTKSNCKQRSEV